MARVKRGEIGGIPDRIRGRHGHEDDPLLERAAAGVPTEEGLVFVTPRGLPVSNAYLTKHFQALLTAAGLPTMRLHDLRHGAATLLVGAGAAMRKEQADRPPADPRLLDLLGKVAASR